MKFFFNENSHVYKYFTRIRQFVNAYKPSHKKSHFCKNKHILQKDNYFQL